MFTEKIIEQIKEHYEYLVESGNKECTCFVELPYVPDNNRWAICLAWMDYDNTDDWQVYGKVAFQPWRSMLQEYDIDWLMPYDENTGEVDDSELTIRSESDLEFALVWWYEAWKRIVEEIEKENEEEDEDAA